MSAVRGLVEELKCLTELNFISFEHVHVSRNYNKATHVLAALEVALRGWNMCHVIPLITLF